MSSQGDKNCNQEVPRTPDSGIGMMEGQEPGTTANATNDPQNAMVAIERHGVTVRYTLGQITAMGASLARARADGLFPPTTAASHDVRAITSDYFRFVQLTAARGTAPPEEWNQMRHVVQLLVEITQEIRARDKVAAEQTEEERVQAHVTNMMSGVSAETKLYNIVKHAVTFAMNNGSGDEAATLTGQSMVNILHGIRGAINDMADQGTHGVNNVNVETVLEEVFGMIDFALSNFVGPLDQNVEQMRGQLNRVDGQISHVDGQIMHLNAIGQHVNAIDGHVHSLGNNINAFGTLLNSTNGNVVSLTTQIALLQTIVNMLPRMIAEACQQMLPGATQEAMGPIIAIIEGHLGTALPIGTANGTQQQPRGVKKFFNSVKKLFRKK
ncbi:hypothetical protein F4813DRAFT_397982 [Daldinia decipiens]|uniref:uncharacterized protein n=1 Tax=Daldinia decipiens TaxID=326647 RepID=UPI0020C3C5BD|nr:uncharacterized protein F4813DRAFT_397982 [Daldinia decipiens]KAI1655837.1 hypothetical protein F4813DRAFT_397982 [Daldinia decipiens]